MKTTCSPVTNKHCAGSAYAATPEPLEGCLLSVHGVTFENTLSDRMQEVFVALQRKTKAVFGRLMRPGGSFVPSFISIQQRPPSLTLPIISQSFGSATSLCLCEGHPHTHKQKKREFFDSLIEIQSHQMFTSSNSLIISCVLHSLVFFSIFLTVSISFTPTFPPL